MRPQFHRLVVSRGENVSLVGGEVARHHFAEVARQSPEYLIVSRTPADTQKGNELILKKGS